MRQTVIWSVVSFLMLLAIVSVGLYFGIPQIEENNKISATATAQTLSQIATAQAYANAHPPAQQAVISCKGTAGTHLSDIAVSVSKFVVSFTITCTNGYIAGVQSFPYPLRGDPNKDTELTYLDYATGKRYIVHVSLSCPCNGRRNPQTGTFFIEEMKKSFNTSSSLIFLPWRRLYL